jgi:hypothetical protein
MLGAGILNSSRMFAVGTVVSEAVCACLFVMNTKVTQFIDSLEMSSITDHKRLLFVQIGCVSILFLFLRAKKNAF